MWRLRFKSAAAEKFFAAGLRKKDGASLMRIILGRKKRDLTFCGGQGAACVSCYRCTSQPEMAMGFWLFVIISIGSIPLAGAMARERNRSSSRWLWIAVIVGPLAPLALLLLGDAKRPAPVN